MAIDGEWHSDICLPKIRLGGCRPEPAISFSMRTTATSPSIGAKRGDIKGIIPPLCFVLDSYVGMVMLWLNE